MHKQAHNDLVRVYEAKMLELGIPDSEVKQQALIEQPTSSTAPAGLVAR